MKWLLCPPVLPQSSGRNCVLTAAQAAADAGKGEIDHVVLLVPASVDAPELIQGRKLFIATRNDANASGPRLSAIRRMYDRTQGTKKLILLEGSAHR